MIDTHAHLNFPEFNDTEEVIQRASEAGVDKIINVGSDLENSKRAIELASKYPKLYATVGIHPSDGEKTNLGSDFTCELKKIAQDKKVVAIGESGLDYSRLSENVVSDKEYQKKLFTSHIEVALELNFPIIIHSRDADDDILGILSKYKGQIKGVMHCFTGNWDFAKKVLDLGLLISFTGIITFPNAASLREVVEKIPFDKFMVETDSPLLAPQSHRGERNEPAFVVEVAKKIAEIKKIGLLEIEKATTQNAEAFFNL
jgi:TatD DNase family protein